MTEVIDDIVPNSQDKKFYNYRMFWVGTYLGGPLVAGYFLAANFKAIGQSHKVKATWLITILATVVIFAIVFAIPENSKIPNQLIPVAYTLLASGLYKIMQEEEIKVLKRNGAEPYSWWRIIGLGFAGLIISVVILMVIYNGVDIFKFLR